MSTPDPLKELGNDSDTVSEKSFIIAGIEVVVFGLDEIPRDVKNVVCLWLLHPRLSDRSNMAPLANATIAYWNKKLKQKAIKSSTPGLIAASFDQRNHGSRLVDPLANEAWKGGNPRHAQDMFSIYQGTAADTSQLISYLSAYIFPRNERTLVEHFALGVSLGGHSVWHCVLHDPRITTGVSVIGCPDYLNLMQDRARLSKLHSWTQSSPPGSTFIGSQDFPQALVEAVETYDPAGLFLGSIRHRTPESYERKPTPEEIKKIAPLMREKLHGKRILLLSGGADKLVPYAQGEAFLRWLKNATGPAGWSSGCDLILRDLIFDGVGHAVGTDMVQQAVYFIAESLQKLEDYPAGYSTAKI